MEGEGPGWTSVVTCTTVKECLVVPGPIGGANSIFPGLSQEKGHSLRYTWLPLWSWWPLCLLINYGEAFQIHWMSCGLTLLVDRWWSLKVFPESVTKSPTWLHYVLFCTVGMWLFILVNYSALLAHVVLVLGGHEQSPYGIILLEMYLFA